MATGPCGSQLGNAAAIAAIARPHHGPNADRIGCEPLNDTRSERGAAVPKVGAACSEGAAKTNPRTMAQGHRDALAVARGTAWDHGYRLGMRMAEEARNPLPPKRAEAQHEKALAAFPPAAEEVTQGRSSMD